MDDGSQYAYGENVGWLNAEPGGEGGDGVEVDDSDLTGYVWGENVGWINLSPAVYGGVTNDGNGNLSGYAYGENVGWINFSPTNGGVTIDSNGDFDGWAWGENIGWIHFQNQSVPYKVQTAWTVPSPTTTTEDTTSTTTSIPSTTTTTARCICKKIYEEDSEEVELLRYIRDNVLSQSSEGREIIRI